MIIIGVGANLPNPDIGSPRANCGAALEKLENLNIYVKQRSLWYKSQPVPRSDQPWYVNGVITVTTSLGPFNLMERLLEVEIELGRYRTRPNAPRALDLDIIAYDDAVIDEPGSNRPQLQIPHPRMHLRAFVITPLCDISPNWMHPTLGDTAEQLRKQISIKQQKIQPMVDAEGLYGTEWR